MISRTNFDLKELRKKIKTPLPHSEDKITCGICGGKFRPEDMTGKTVGRWFVICCEKCKREEQAIGQVVWEPKTRGK